MTVVTTKVRKVSLFRNGAEIVRSGSAELPAGTQTVVIRGLSGSAALDSVRLSVSEGVRCEDLRFEAAETGGQKESEAIAEEIAAAEKQAEIRALQAELWKANGNFTGREAMETGEIRSYIQSLPEVLGQLSLEEAEFRKKIRALTEKKEEAERLEGLPAAVAVLTVPEAGEVFFELRYHDSAARWRPVYEIHSDGEGPLEFRMRARMSQTTGEDWTDTELSLYTGNPSAGGRLPELDSVCLEIRVPEPEKPLGPPMMPAFMGGMMAQASVMPGAGGMQSAEAVPRSMPLMKRAETGEAEIRGEDTMTEYALPGTKSLKNGAESVADLRTDSVPAKYRIVSVSCKDPAAYLTAGVSTKDLPVASAFSAGIYLKGMFTGRLSLDPDLTEETAELTLGREEQVHVSREELPPKASSAFLKGQKTLEHQYTVRVSNNSGSEKTVLVRDLVPLSRAKEIQVETRELSGAALDQETGILEKELKVPAGGAEEFRVSYKVSWPKEKQLKKTAVKGTGGKKYCRSCGSEVFGKFCPTCGARYE